MLKVACTVVNWLETHPRGAILALTGLLVAFGITR